MLGMGMSMSCSIRLRAVQVQDRTSRTKVIEFMRSPHGGTWLGEPGFLTVKQIAEGAELGEAKVRSVLRSKTFESRAVGRRKVYRIAPTTTDPVTANRTDPRRLSCGFCGAKCANADGCSLPVGAPQGKPCGCACHRRR
jgi:hypothetical protein